MDSIAAWFNDISVSDDDCDVEVQSLSDLVGTLVPLPRVMFMVMFMLTALQMVAYWLAGVTSPLARSVAAPASTGRFGLMMGVVSLVLWTLVSLHSLWVPISLYMRHSLRPWTHFKLQFFVVSLIAVIVLPVRNLLFNGLQLSGCGWSGRYVTVVLFALAAFAFRAEDDKWPLLEL
jgi:hypothetical protein